MGLLFWGQQCRSISATNNVTVRFFHYNWESFRKCAMPFPTVVKVTIDETDKNVVRSHKSRYVCTMLSLGMPKSVFSVRKKVIR
jgi:hypothetical protein